MKRSITVWVLAVSLLHVLVGCGGDDEASDDGATTGDTTAGADAGDTSAGADAGDTSGSEDTGATADTGGGGDAGTTPADTGGQAEADFTEVFAMVFEAEGCTGGYCHGSGQGGLMLSDAATTHGNLVNVDAANPMCDLTKLVVPGEPELLQHLGEVYAAQGRIAEAATVWREALGATRGADELAGRIRDDLRRLEAQGER